MDHDGSKRGLHPAANKLPAASKQALHASRINDQIGASLHFTCEVMLCCEFDGLHSELTVRLQLACEASLFRIVRSALQIADGDVANDCKPSA